MAVMPKRVKHRKSQRGKMKGNASRCNFEAFGEYGLQAVEPAWLTAQQIESMRVSLSRKLKKVGKMFLRVFPDKPITKKPAETRMGKGKGGVDKWVFVVKRERIICEISGVVESEAREILKSAAYKLPMKVKFVKKA